MVIFHDVKVIGMTRSKYPARERNSVEIFHTVGAVSMLISRSLTASERF